MVTHVQKNNKISTEVQVLNTSLTQSKENIVLPSKSPENTTQDDSKILQLEKGKVKKKKNIFKSLFSQIFSIKICLSVIIMLLIIISTISIFVATIVLQAASIEESTDNLGSQTKLRTVEYVNNFIKYPFQITDGITRRITKLDSLSPNIEDWGHRIEELISTVVSFELSYASFTANGYFFGVSRNTDSPTKEPYYILEYFSNGWFYKPVNLDKNLDYNMTNTKIVTMNMDSFPWWTVPNQTKKKSWSSLYATNFESVWISAYHPTINSTGDVEFVITTDLTVQDINTFLDSITISNNSFIYLISTTTSEMIACSKSTNETLYVYNTASANKLDRKTLSQSKKPEVKAIGKILHDKYGANLSGFNKTTKYTTSSGATYLVNMIEVEDKLKLGLSWSVLVIMSVDDFMSSVILFRNIVLIADCVILCTSLVIAIIVSMSITAPLVSLGNDMDALGKGEFKGMHKKRLILFHEVKKLRNHFLKMSSAVDGFMKYVPREIVSSFIGSDANTFSLGVESKHIAILFSDIKNFTTICEATEPNILIAVLGKYFELTSEVVYRNRGVLDKYIGDSLMALFGAPDTFEHYVFHGCNAAFEMQKALQPYNDQLEKEGRATLYTRVGVSCGDVLVGNIGSSYRLSYTCLGDHVNLSSRLEGLNKVYGTNIMVSETCYDIVKDLFLFRTLDVVAVKGKVNGVKVYQIVGRKWSPFEGDSVTVSQEKVEYCRTYNTILEDLYFKKKFNVAEKAFKEYADKYNQDPAALEMAYRCRSFVNNPPPDNWNGVYVATDK